MPPANWQPWGSNQNFFQQGGASPDLMRYLQQQYQPHQFPENERTRQPAFLQGSLAPYIGQATLTQLLLGQGRTDPQAFNRNIADINRNAQSSGNQLQAILAQRGLGGSGVGQALGAAVGQAGNAQVAGARANEAALAEQRKRSDLDLLLRLFMDPYAGYQNNALQQYLGERQTQRSGMGAVLGSLGPILGGIANMQTAGAAGAAGGGLGSWWGSM